MYVYKRDKRIYLSIATIFYEKVDAIYKAKTNAIVMSSNALKLLTSIYEVAK